MVLSSKAKDSQLIILDKIELAKGKTKEMAGNGSAESEKIFSRQHITIDVG